MRETHTVARTPMTPEAIASAVAKIVRSHLGSAYRVFLFGSRAKGTARQGSDYDFGIEGPSPVEWRTLGAIKDDAENLPTLHKIDVVDFATVSEGFNRSARQSARPIHTTV